MFPPTQPIPDPPAWWTGRTVKQSDDPVPPEFLSSVLPPELPAQWDGQSIQDLLNDAWWQGFGYGFLWMVIVLLALCGFMLFMWFLSKHIAGGGGSNDYGGGTDASIIMTFGS